MELARYDGLLEAIPNAYVLLTPLTTQEAVLSSRIEGTQATLSAYFEKNHEEYYDRLLRVSSDGDWTGWTVYFLKSIVAQAKENAEKTRKIIELRENTLHRLSDLTGSKSNVDAVDYLFNRPIFSGSDFNANPSINSPTARRILKIMLENGIVVEFRPSIGRRSAIYGFRELLNIVEGRELF